MQDTLLSEETEHQEEGGTPSLVPVKPTASHLLPVPQSDSSHIKVLLGDIRMSRLHCSLHLILLGAPAAWQKLKEIFQNSQGEEGEKIPFVIELIQDYR